MTQYQITPEEMYQVEKKVVYWHELETTHRDWCPTVVKPGFSTFEQRWYTVERPGRPIETPDLSEAKTEIAALIQGTAKVVFQHVDIEIPWSTLQASRSSGGAFDIQNISIQATIKQLAKQEAHFLYRGASVPSVNGLFGIAGASSTASDYWETAPGAPNVIRNMCAQLYANEFTQPFDLILGLTLKDGLDKFINSSPVTDTTQRDSVMRLLGGGSIYYEKQEPSSGADEKRVYPFPTPTANDGVALLVKADPNNFQLLVEQPITTVFGNFDTGRKAYPALVFQAVTLRTWNKYAICKHTAIDKEA